MPTLSVIVPSYERSQLLDKTLHALTLQTSRDFEVLLIDHGSTDDTREVYDKYKHTLSMQYYYLSRTRNDPGKPRDLAVRHATTPLIAFLDCGIVVPSSYVTSHIQFHTNHRGYVGIGLYHGHKNNPQDQCWNVILPQVEMNIDQICNLFDQHPDFYDDRLHINLTNSPFSWLEGWTGNLSMHTEAYLSIGGFDPDQSYGFEDIDLSYRLFKQGLKFAFVDGGWGVHLPHPRPLAEIYEEENLGWKTCYRKHRTLSLEAFGHARTAKTAQEGMSRSKKIFQYLTLLGEVYSKQDTSRYRDNYKFIHPSLLIGGKKQDAQFFDYIALSNETAPSTDSVWACSGTLVPLADMTLQTVIVTDIWKWLGYPINEEGSSLLESLILEIKRTAQKAFFIDSSLITDMPKYPSLSIAELKGLCWKHNLSFELITFGTANLASIPVGS